MEFSKGKLQNINKKLLAGALSLTLVMVPLAGCSTSNNVNDQYTNFEYSVNESDEYEATGKIDYQLLKDYEFVVIENEAYDITEYYICKYVCIYGYGRIKYVKEQRYDNIFNNQTIFTYNDGQRKMIYSEKLENYFYATNNIKKNYTVEDVKLIFSEIKEIYLKQNGKQKVKEK